MGWEGVGFWACEAVLAPVRVTPRRQPPLYLFHPPMLRLWRLAMNEIWLPAGSRPGCRRLRLGGYSSCCSASSPSFFASPQERMKFCSEPTRARTRTRTGRPCDNLGPPWLGGYVRKPLLTEAHARFHSRHALLPSRPGPLLRHRSERMRTRMQAAFCQSSPRRFRPLPLSPSASLPLAARGSPAYRTNAEETRRVVG